ncbi:hypothetical protein DIT71_04125 [Marinobacter vulgaris]|uniref:HTH araC/xylS-type domain-containing protein n=1 Tax=Marinobacter vulgaris TaxID=1928331 RepID=A0A2V4A1G6_9GAMM|nr:hypothetical protein DIT71_04125 [Marinobacter vulgaris]TSJ71851.1 AraC family transcriptional regulator [Marinobacter vulgaris]
MAYRRHHPALACGRASWRALQSVADTNASLPEIAESLGFAEVSTFYRAFRRWTGSPPVRWRKQQN